MDARFEQSSLRSLSDVADQGWIREIREALGMTTRHLAERMELSQSAVTQIERSERAGRVQVATLRKAADALGCELVYALVPRTSLEHTRRDQAMKIAATAFEATPGDDLEVRQGRIEHYADKLVERGQLWDEPVRGETGIKYRS